MPEIQCRKCNAWTNTTLCDHIYSKDGYANTCYARYINNAWEKGCGYDAADIFDKNFADRVIRTQNNVDTNLILKDFEEGD